MTGRLLGVIAGAPDVTLGTRRFSGRSIMVRTIFGGVSGAVVFGLLLLVQKITSLMFSALGGVPELAIISGLLVFGATGAILAHFVGD